MKIETLDDPFSATEQSSHRLSDRTYSNQNSSNFFNFWEILRIAQKWWWLVLTISIVSILTTAYFVRKITPVYRATSTIEVKQEERQILGEASAVENFVVDNEFFETQIQLLKSQTLAGDIVDQFNLLSDPEFTLEEGSRDLRRKFATDMFAQKLQVSAVGRSRLIQVSFEHTNPSIAAEISNAVTDTFVTYNLERKYNATSYARDFIEDRLKFTKDILEKSERELVDYAKVNDLVTLRDTQGNVSPGFLASESLVALNAELLNARTRRVELEHKYNIHEKQGSPVFGQSEGGVLEALRLSHTELTSEYIEKSAIYVPEFPIMVELQERIDYIASQIATETSLLQSNADSKVKEEYDVALATEQELNDRFNTLKETFDDIRDKTVEYNIRKREVDTNRSQYDALLQRLKEVSIADEVGSDLISLVDRAEPPRNPFKPRVLLSLLAAGVFGSFLGTTLILAIEFIDDRIKSPDDVKQKLGYVVMGVIPVAKNVIKTGKTQTKDSEDAKGMRRITDILNNPASALAEAYSSLRTNLQFSGPDGGPKVIHITSTRSGEGKSVTSLGVALRYAGIGDKVLLIDADMRLPTFKHGVQDSVGLSGLLTSKANIDDNILASAFENLYLLPSGANVPNPSEILSSYRLEEILTHVRDKFSYIIVDSPPVLGLADATILASSCDASLLIVEGASTRTPSVKATLDRLLVSGIKVLGIVITKYTQQSKGYYNYYQYSYGEASTNYSSAKGSKKSSNTIVKDYMDIMTNR